MTSIRVWAFSGIAAIALAVGALLATGAVSSAQESTTPTPAATTAPSDSSGGTATPAPKSGHNCPNMGTGTGSITAPTRSRSLTNGASGGA